MRPAIDAQLAEIPGIGARKLELYGEELLRITQQHSGNRLQPEESPEILQGLSRLWSLVC